MTGRRARIDNLFRFAAMRSDVEKAFHELEYELMNRPSLRIPLEGIRGIASDLALAGI